MERQAVPHAAQTALPVRDRPATQHRVVAEHRVDIDGLRALAVLPVVAFHAGIHAVRGGFVGVDIFFVISGFLITQLLIRDIRAEQFSIVRFYERRIRRILPALLATLTATFLLGLYYCLPAELVDLARSLVAAILSFSNVYFWEVAGYFDAPAAGKPLLHTWSLAVEEQFYIVWPLLLLYGHRLCGRYLLHATAALTALSLAASALLVHSHPDATFYLPFTRFWELSIGGLLALGLCKAALNGLARNLLAAAGLLLIAGSVLLINSDMPFPGILAIPPCVGAACIILAGRDGDSFIGRLLSLRPLVFVGVISYSLYLWHWPITVFQRNYTFLAGGLGEASNKILIVAVSLLVAWLSWRFIEQPFRAGPRRPQPRQLFRLAAVGCATGLVMAGTAWLAAGFPGRYSAEELRVAEFLSYPTDSWRVGKCFIAGSKSDPALSSECLALSASRKNYLLLGDSHAAQLWSAFSQTFHEVNFLEATAADCFPTVVHSVSESARCTAVIDGVLQNFLGANHIDRVFLIARWKPALLDNVAETLRWFNERHIPVTLVGPSALYDSPVPRLIVRSLREADEALPQRHFNSAVRDLDSRMAAMAAEQKVPYISLLSIQCATAGCDIVDAHRVPIIFDQEHLTSEGALLLAARVRRRGLIS
jgi:peptidoglycan/LPS O-acetylase OafA/YrhL